MSGNTELFCVCFLIVNNCKLFVALFCTKEVLFFGPICRQKSVNFLLFFLAFGTHLIKDIEPSLFFLCSLFLFSVLVSISILFCRGLNCHQEKELQTHLLEECSVAEGLLQVMGRKCILLNVLSWQESKNVCGFVSKFLTRQETTVVSVALLSL